MFETKRNDQFRRVLLHVDLSPSGYTATKQSRVYVCPKKAQAIQTLVLSVELFDCIEGDPSKVYISAFLFVPATISATQNVFKTSRQFHTYSDGPIHSKRQMISLRKALAGWIKVAGLEICCICPLHQGPLTITIFPEKSAEYTGIVLSLGIGLPLWNAFFAALSILWDLQSTHAAFKCMR